MNQRAALFPPRANKNVSFLSLSEYHTKHGFSTQQPLYFKFIREEEEATTTTRERNELYSEHISNSNPQKDEFDQIPRVRSLDRECLLME